MTSPTPPVRPARGRQALAGLLALVLVSVVVLRTSQAAFTAQVVNEGNSFTAGSIELTSGAAGALFDVRDLAPGSSVTRCITIVYAGTARDIGAVHLYGGGFMERPGPRTGSIGLGTKLRLHVEEGSGRAGRNGSCGGFTPAETIVDDETLAQFNRRHTDHATGVGTWRPAPSTSRTYRFTVTLDPSTAEVEQSAGVTDLVFGWAAASGTGDG